jgi:tetratricopeptide (TPR) repeat protein
MLMLLADRYYENGQFDRWQATLDRAYSLSRGLPDAELRSQAACDKAYGLADQGHFDEADRLLAAALADLAALPDASAGEAECRTNESITASRRGDGPRAVRAAERAVQLEQMRKGPPGSGFEAQAALATAYLVSGRTASADRAFRQLVGLLESVGLERGRDAATIFHNWSVTLERAGQYLQALPIAQRAVDIARERDAEHGASGTLLLGLGRALRTVGRNEEAIPLLEESVTKARRGGSPRRLVEALMELATAYRDGDRLDGTANALREAERVLEGDAKMAQSAYPAQVDGHQARLALARGRVGEALALAQRALDRLPDPEHSNLDVLHLTTVLAETQIASADFEGGAASARRALALANEVLRGGELQYSSDAGQTHLLLGLALAGEGNLPAARNELTQALDHLRPSVGPGGRLTRRAQLELVRLGASPAPR